MAVMVRTVLSRGEPVAGEVVLAHEQLPCPPHRSDIKRLRDMPDEVAIEERSAAVVMQLIAVAFADGVVGCMKIVACALNRQHYHIAR